MNVAYINPFISSAIETYKNMMTTVAKPGKPFLKRKPYPTYDISAVIGLSGKAIGSIAMAYDETGARKAISKMVGGDIGDSPAVLTDGVGEIVNIVAGYAKKDLTQFNLEISLPQVVRGKGHSVFTPSDTECVIIPFITPLGNFNMEVALITP